MLTICKGGAPILREATEVGSRPDMTRPKILQATMARSLFALDVALVAVAWPLALWLARYDVANLLRITADMRGLVYPLSDLTFLYAMGLYRREAFVESHRSVMRVPTVVGMGAVVAWFVCAAPSRIVSSIAAPRPSREELQLLWLAFVCFTICAFAARVVLDILLRRRWFRRQLLVVGAGVRAWDLSRMLSKEGASLNYDITFLHDPALGGIDPRLESDPDGEILRIDQSRVLEVARQVRADQIVIAPDERRGMDLGQLLACKKAGFPVVQYLSFVEHEIRRVDIKRMDIGWLVFSDGFYFGAIDQFLKRAFDLVGHQRDHVDPNSSVGSSRHAGNSHWRTRAGVLPARPGDT